MGVWSNTDTQAAKPKWITKRVTFNASSASVVNVANDTIDLPGYGYDLAEPVLYSTGGGTAPTGLTNGTTYYAIPAGGSLYKLATTANNARAGTAINITALGTGSNHSIQALAANVYFVDQTEAQVASNKAKGINGAGWWRIDTYTDAQGRTRWKTECIVAMTVPVATSGDAADDSVVADA